jgi:hypothetical protein
LNDLAGLAIYKNIKKDELDVKDDLDNISKILKKVFNLLSDFQELDRTKLTHEQVLRVYYF